MNRFWETWALQRDRLLSEHLLFMRKSGDLQRYPEIYALIGVPQNPIRHPEGDVFNHTCQVLDWAQLIANSKQLSDRDRLVLVFACLCHDFGKAVVKPNGDPVTYINENGYPTSPKHAYYGIGPTCDFLYQIGADIPFVESVSRLVEFHMHHLSYKDNNPREKTLRKIKQSGVDVRLLVLLSICDNNGRVGPDGERSYRYGVPEGMIRMVHAYLKFHMRSQIEPDEPAVITGVWLIQKGYPTSINRYKFPYGEREVPAFGVIINVAADAQRRGELTFDNADHWFRRAIDENRFGFDPNDLI